MKSFKKTMKRIISTSLIVGALMFSYFSTSCTDEDPTGPTEGDIVDLEDISQLPFKIAYAPKRSSPESSSVFLIHPDSVNIAQFIDDFSSGSLLWSPNGEYLAYNSEDDNITIINKERILEATLPFRGYERANDFRWSHSGRFLANGAYFAGVYYYDTVLDTSKKIISGNRIYFHNPVFSPDDSLIAFVQHSYGTVVHIVIKDLEDLGSFSICERLPFRTGWDEHLDLNWISDDELLFKSYDDGIFLQKIDLSADTLADLTQVVSSKINKLLVSPDRSHYAFTTSSSTSRINYAAIGDWSPVQVELQGTIKDFDWVPSNDAIVYTGNQGVYLFRLDGTGHYRILEHNFANENKVSVAPK